MKMRALVPLFEFSAAQRRSDAQHAMSALVVENMGHIVDSSYFRRFGMLEARIAREKRRHEFWLKQRLLDAAE